jgi:UDP-2,3-diacylglucosamine hydrolase
MDGPIFFVSDTHFKVNGSSADERRKRVSFIDFLSRIDGAKRLYLVGDIFDFWFEYRSVVPRHYHEILEAVSSLKRGGTDIYLTGGNHDFWFGSYMTDALGFTILPPLAVQELQGKRIVITHGDALIPHDIAYKALKAVIRSHPVIALARAVHPDILFAFARQFSKASKGITEKQTERCARLLRAMAPTSFFRWDNDIFVMGHVHYPCIDTFGQKVFVILGDWEEHCSYGELSGGTISLKYYRPRETTLTENR